VFLRAKGKNQVDIIFRVRSSHEAGDQKKKKKKELYKKKKNPIKDD
jgi:hypothetical protein